MAYERHQEFCKCHEEHYRDGVESMMLWLQDVQLGFMNGQLSVESADNFGLEKDMDNIRLSPFKK
jgi:hypothetical protein